MLYLALLLVSALAPASGGSCSSDADSWLLDSNRTALVVIDVQQNFLDKLPLDTRAALVDHVAFLMRVAAALEMPIVATAEDYLPRGNAEDTAYTGAAPNPPMVAKLAALLPGGAPVNKMVWNAYAPGSETRAALDGTGRDTFLLVGLETDVCVGQTALGLRAAGFRVFVAADACGTAPPHHAAGLERMRGAGVVVTDVKGAYYELVRDIATISRVDRYVERTGGGAPKCARDATM
ncbi:Isochorismatase-like protein [Pelagophyceae sp. CCMP2097]|nr:Isochorismatase-like protein [Pelagophyceae sp. CCMP2097]